MIELKNVSVKIKKKIIINDLSCCFPCGIHGLLGENGAGKTTLLRAMLGLYTLKEGSAACEGRRIADCKVGYLPQTFGLFPNMTIREALTYLGNTKDYVDKPENYIMECLSDVYLEDKIDDKISTLSGGMVRRVGIAQALMGDPEILVLDEPTAGLDPEERLRFKNLIKRKYNKKTVIISTHIVEDLEYLSDYVTIMRAGTILRQDTIEGIMASADNKVYKIKSSATEELNGEFYVVKEFEEQGEKMLRVLGKHGGQDKLLQPTLEDGYLCILKNI